MDIQLESQSERDDRMALLKRKNRRKNLMKELSSIVTISDEPFLDIEENDLFCRKVFKRLAETKFTSTLTGLNSQENIAASIKLLKEIFTESNCRTMIGRLFFYRDKEIEVVELKLSDIHRNLEEIVDMIKFTTGHGDFIFVTDDLKVGICIERTEYQYEFYRWGIILS